MIGNYFARLTGSKRNLLALLASSAVFTAGCSNMATTAPSANPFSSPATLSGTIHGGNQPVVGATVTLWYAAQATTSPGIQAAVTTSDSSGSFNFVRDPVNGNTDTGNEYSCPSSGGSPLVYVTATGGNTQPSGGTSTNSAAAFIALYGDCTFINASNFVYMSEVTTVATMAAVQQFYSPFDGTLKTSGLGQERLIALNLPNTVKLLADPATGLAKASSTTSSAPGGNIAPGVTLTVTPETSKINTLANIISACINATTSADPNCTALFSAATPPTPNLTNQNPQTPFPTATNTLQALYYIFTNPTNGSSANMTTLFGLAPAVGAPYQPALASQPTDWSIGVNYANATGSATCGTSTAGTGNFISSPTDVNIDSADNVWFGNAATAGNLSSLSAAGAPLYCVNFDPANMTAGGTFDSFSPSTNVFTPNVWAAAGTTLYRYNPNNNTTLAFPVGVTPLAIAADGVGNVYFTAVAGTTGSLYFIPGAANATAAVAPLQISNTVGPSPVHLMPDYKAQATQGNIWVSSGTTSVSKVGVSLPGMNGFATTPFTTAGNSNGVATSRNSVFVSSFDTNAIDQFIPSGTTFVSANGFPFTATTAGIKSPMGIAVDGRTNTWITNNANPSISEISVYGGTGGAITPSTGYVKAASYLNASRAVAVDQAGNVWIAGAGNAFLTEIVGEGVPVYAPYAVGMANGRFQSIP